MTKDEIYARMMHTPDDPVRARQRAALRDAWKHLLPLHRALIDMAGAEYGETVAPVSGPGHLLKLLQDDPFFAWIKPLTSLIVDIDTISRTDFVQADADAIVARIERLFSAASDAGFSARYLSLIQSDVDVAIAHAAVRQLVPKLGA